MTKFSWMTKILKWFFATKLGYHILLWHVTRKENKFVEEFSGSFSNRPMIELSQDTVQQKYQEGLHVLKSKVRNGSYQLETEEELLKLAREETPEQKQFRKVMEQVYIYKGQDVKDDISKNKMIDKRIGDYYALQKYNEERELLKQIRQAKKNDDNDLAERLENEWKQRFRPSIH